MRLVSFEVAAIAWQIADAWTDEGLTDGPRMILELTCNSDYKLLKYKCFFFHPCPHRARLAFMIDAPANQ